MTDKRKLLEQIRADIIKNNVCPDLAREAKNLVFGDGNIDAEMFFIGEAPGKNEDEQALPFVGASGKFLDVMLESAGIERSEIYVTNIVKYRPPQNRDPSPDEKTAFLPYLVRQLKVIKPKLVVTLGRHSMEYFLPKQKISQIHGQPSVVNFDGYNGVIVPLYHPASALYNGRMRSTLMEDFNKLPAIINNLQNIRQTAKGE